MQITIMQTEIETAIRNHILGLISVRENMKIDIDLRATRGSEGFTAVVDIMPDDGPGNKQTKPQTAPAKTTAPVAEKPAPAKTEAPKAEVEEAQPEAEPEAEVEAAPKKGILPFAKKEAEPAPEPTGEPTKSIFASLKKPVNTPTVPPAAANG